jgi:hypothetical protein
MPRSRSSSKNNFREDDDVRWQWSETTSTAKGSPQGEHYQAHQFGSLSCGNANFAWVQHFIHHIAPAAPGSSGDKAGFVLANGSISSNQSGEGDIRRVLIEADFVDCMVARPGHLFYSTYAGYSLSRVNGAARPAYARREAALSATSVKRL